LFPRWRAGGGQAWEAVGRAVAGPSGVARRWWESESLNQPKPLKTIGWQEWIALPGLGIERMLCKIDTGARSSALFATQIELVEHEVERHDQEAFIRFTVQLSHESPGREVTAEAPLLTYRRIRSSNGAVSRRPVVVTDVSLLGIRWPIQITLADRRHMRFPMLLGRTAIRDRFFVDVNQSFLGQQRNSAGA
jgi:hypothetical protein